MLSGWQIQAMKEAEDARIWEELNAPDPFEAQMKKAAVGIREAENFLDISTNRLMDALTELEGTPMQAKIESFYDQLEEIRIDLRIIASNYERGLRE